jgi:hypothetical protein
MKRALVRIAALSALLVSALLVAPTRGQGPPEEKGAGGEKPAAKPDPAVVAKLIAQLSSDDFLARDTASQRLAELDEVPDALRQAARDADLEVSRRARAAIAAITARVEERAFQAILRDLHKVELDRLVRRMVKDKKLAGGQEWKVLQAVVKAVKAEAEKTAGRRFEVPAFDLGAMRHLLFDGETNNPVSVSGAALLSAGATPYITSVTNSLVIVDGDFTGATGIDNSLLIVRGNVGRVTGVTNSIILATGHWEGATVCQGSFAQVDNQRVRFTGSSDSVLINTLIRTTGDTNSGTINTDKGPLRLLKFSPRPTDAQLAWSEAVDGLAVAVAPAEQKGRFLIRWKNVGTDAVQLPWARLNADLIEKTRDDLLGHVSLRGADGKTAPARQYPPPQRAGYPFRAFVLGPGQTLDETIDLWAYVEKPAAGGKYRLSIGLDIDKGRRVLGFEARTWSGKIESKPVEVVVGD